MFSRFFINRPVLSNVLAILMMVLGGVAIFTLPITQYPPITPPTVQVTATYLGATAEALIKKVALPIEQEVNGVDGMIYMNSSSTSSGNYTLTITFDIGTDPNMAQVLVENRVSAVLSLLPKTVQDQGVITKKTSTSFLQVIALTSPHHTYDSLFLNNYATIHLNNELSRVPGVGNVMVFGIGEYAMRIWLDPGKMKHRFLVPSDVINAIKEQNLSVPTSQIAAPPTQEGAPLEYNINVNGPLNSVNDFENIIVKTNLNQGGKITRLKDVAHVELGSKTYNQFFNFNKTPAGGIAIFQLPGSNALTTAKAIKEKMSELAKEFPEDLQYHIPFDTTMFVKDSMIDVIRTLLESGILVLIVMVLFLQNARAALVPATTVPVTIIGAFAIMGLLGFSINTLTLFAIVLSIGIVVDDAIVVVEGAMQHIERGKSPHDAAILAMDNLLGPIIGITLVLMAVFIPAAFMPGIIGQMYRQFALVIAATALLSAINALTLKPTQCALWLRARPKDEEDSESQGNCLHQTKNKKENFFFRLFNAIYHPLDRGYAALIPKIIPWSGGIFLLGLLLIGLVSWKMIELPTGFIPTEDQGYLMIMQQLPDGASLSRTQKVMTRTANQVTKLDAVDSLFVIGGISPLDQNSTLANCGVIYVVLKKWGQRGPRGNLLDVYTDLNKIVTQERGAASIVIVPPPIPGLGLSGGFQMEVCQTNDHFNYQELGNLSQSITTKAMDSSVIRMALGPFSAKAPQLHMSVDRRKAETYGVNIDDLFQTVQTYLGSSGINHFTKYGYNFNVMAQADIPYRSTTEAMYECCTKGQGDAMVPLGSLVSVKKSLGPSIISLYNLYPAAAIIGAVNRGYSSGQGMKTMNQIAQEMLPQGSKAFWTGMSYQEQLAGSSIYFVFGLGLLLVYFLLSAQYESWIRPLAVILAVPLSLSGTVLMMALTGLPNNLYVQIGIVLLIALAAKNAILVVEMAREFREAGDSIPEATAKAAANRFRPIVMTSVTFILGVIPLILSSGAGAIARKCLGLAVASGMIASTSLTIFFVPCFFVILERWEEKREKRA